MNGQSSILNDFLKRYDPILIIPKIVKIINGYNKSNWRIFDAIRRWWIVKWKYPIMRIIVKQMQDATAKLLYKHPDNLVFIVTRYFVYLMQYCNVFKVDPNTCLDSIFPPDTLYIKMNTEPLKEGSKITDYNIIIKSCIPVNYDKPQDDKICITNLNVNTESRQYTISQTCYDTYNSSLASTAKILYSKEFTLQEDGKLYNPNYAFSKELFEEDLEYYRIMVSQLLIFLGGLLESSTMIFFIEPNNTKNENIL